MKNWLTVKELAEYLGKSPKAIRDLKDRAQLPFRKLGRTLYFSVKEIDRMIENGDGLRLEKIGNI